MSRLCLVLLSIVVLGSAGAMVAGGTATAEQVVRVDQDRLDELQEGCLDRGAFGVKSWEFALAGSAVVAPDLNVTIDTNGDGDADREATVAAQNRDPSSSPFRPSIYRLSGQGLILAAFVDVPSDWEGRLSLDHVQCDFAPPPADACEEFPDRIVVRLDQRLGDPSSGLTQSSAFLEYSLGGIFNVTLQSFDAHSEHGGQGQEHESWYVTFDPHGVGVSTDPIDDLPDGQDVMNQKVGQVRLVSSSHITITHDRWSPSGELFETPESVTAVCVALDRVAGDITYVPGFPGYVPPQFYYVPQRFLFE